MPIRENIAFGDLSAIADDPRIEAAARKSTFSRVLERFPKGLDQVLGRRFAGGVELSGGEWQRVALSRAYLRDAQITILDEPSANLDARSELSIFERFMGLTNGRTSLMISHRFYTVRAADRILVLEGGAISEDGSHAELLAARGRYAELFEIQAAGYR